MWEDFQVSNRIKRIQYGFLMKYPSFLNSCSISERVILFKNSEPQSMNQLFTKWRWWGRIWPTCLLWYSQLFSPILLRTINPNLYNVNLNNSNMISLFWWTLISMCWYGMDRLFIIGSSWSTIWWMSISTCRVSWRSHRRMHY